MNRLLAYRLVLGLVIATAITSGSDDRIAHAGTLQRVAVHVLNKSSTKLCEVQGSPLPERGNPAVPLGRSSQVIPETFRLAGKPLLPGEQAVLARDVRSSDFYAVMAFGCDRHAVDTSKKAPYVFASPGMRIDGDTLVVLYEGDQAPDVEAPAGQKVVPMRIDGAASGVPRLEVVNNGSEPICTVFAAGSAPNARVEDGLKRDYGVWLPKDTTIDPGESRTFNLYPVPGTFRYTVRLDGCSGKTLGESLPFDVGIASSTRLEVVKQGRPAVARTPRGRGARPAGSPSAPPVQRVTFVAKPAPLCRKVMVTKRTNICAYQNNEIVRAQCERRGNNIATARVEEERCLPD
jgi:hypothetical protein